MNARRVATLLAVSLLNIATTALAQEGAIAGRVSTVTGEELDGVRVTIPGASFGTMTDKMGSYRLTGVPAGKYTLRAAMIGYQSSEQPVTVTASEVATLDFVLEVSEIALDEIVATGVGVSGTVRFVRDSVFVQSLQGQTANMVMRGGASIVNLGRGFEDGWRATIGGANQPLYVIDGVRINDFLLSGQNQLSTLGPAGIESIEIIKGSTAVGIYGAAGSNGAVLISTTEDLVPEVHEFPGAVIKLQLAGDREHVRRFIESAFWARRIFSESMIVGPSLYVITRLQPDPQAEQEKRRERRVSLRLEIGALSRSQDCSEVSLSWLGKSRGYNEKTWRATEEDQTAGIPTMIDSVASWLESQNGREVCQ